MGFLNFKKKLELSPSGDPKDWKRYLLKEKFSNENLQLHLEPETIDIIVSVQNLTAVASLLRDHHLGYFDHLACITGIDHGLETGHMEVIYSLYSIPHGHHATLKVTLNRTEPEVDSVTDIWRGANWHEREAFDLLGIYFKNHPDLRRILLPADWEGFPLRKDYKEASSYHGMGILHPDKQQE